MPDGKTHTFDGILDKEDYLYAVDSTKNEKALAFSEVIRSLNEINNRLNIVVLNGCRGDDNADNNGEKTGSGTSKEDDEQSKINYQKNNMLVYVTNKIALDNSKGKNTLFTEHLLKNIMRPELEVYELFALTKSRVMMYSKGSQVPAPIISSHDFDGKYLGEKQEDSILAVNTDTPGQLKVWPVRNRKNPVVERELRENEINKWEKIHLPAGTYIVQMIYNNGVTVTAPKVSVGMSNAAGIKFIKNKEDDKQLPICKEDVL